ncbi:MAG: CDP-diacylglycerol--glycerol-3-phosphate 3-phosphatidyltransferase [Mycoplasmoidaceae bacterium]
MDGQKKIFCKQNIPNMLLVFRMLLVPVIVGLLIGEHYGVGNNPVVYQLITPFDTGSYYSNVHLYFLLAAIFFLIAAITDFLDGYIARKFNWVSDFGKLWDPIADKVLVNSVLICFAWMTIIPIFIPIVMIARDVCVDAQKMVAAKKGVVVAANYWGKLKTILQMVGIVLIFFFFNCHYLYIDPAYKGLYWGVQNLMLHLATVMSVASGIIYFIDINKALKNNGQQN